MHSTTAKSPSPSPWKKFQRRIGQRRSTSPKLLASSSSYTKSRATQCEETYATIYYLPHALVSGRQNRRRIAERSMPDGEYEKSDAKLKGDVWICRRTTMQQH